MKRNLLFHLLIIAYLFSLGHAIECRVCRRRDVSCIFTQDHPIRRQCANTNDQCYTWFSRRGSHITAQRNCLSLNSPISRLIKRFLRDKHNGCVKHQHALDCFTICSGDLCN